MHSAHTRNVGNNSIELGNEPALVVGGLDTRIHSPSAVNARWLIGTVLTGVTSIALMGGALTIALQGQYSVDLAKPAIEKEEFPLILGAKSGKGDRAPFNEQFSKKQVIPVSTVTREGQRDYVRVRPYTLVSASLATQRNDQFAQVIPKFDPLSLYEGENANLITASDAIYGANVDGEVSISQRDFPIEALGYADFKEMNDEDIVDQVKKASLFMTDNKTDIAAIPSAFEQEQLRFTPLSEQDPNSLEVLITEENVSFQPKSSTSRIRAQFTERIVPVGEDAVLLDILLDFDANEAEATQILEIFKETYGISKVHEGQILRFSLGVGKSDYETGELVRISLYDNQHHKATIARSDDGTFVAAAEPSSEIVADAFAEATRVNFTGPTPSYFDSIYQTALENEIPSQLIGELIKIYSFDVDYNSTVRPGDTFSILYGMPEEGSNGNSEILFTSVQVNGREYRFYRFRTPDGLSDFYNEEGQSSQQFLLRKPIAAGRFTSGFGMRRHPISKTRRMHAAVDWAAPRGTPILAAGNGTVSRAGWAGGYGKRVEISHGNGYVSTYSHMVNFGEGISKGVEVRQGQVIGFVGTTGLSTGNHLHYELKINNRFVDPLKIKLPDGKSLEGDQLLAFKRERDRIDRLMDDGISGKLIASAAK
ncbi:M23 family metallopeptidase [Rhodobacteraceae bacterium RKSG542]|uniref:M23 family metallopeptidase n=1 Tax=Pseudovibrio flavus TaxID=2529854 RepID=UPI0012BC1BDF|nr:M23 family metallopeptidase [Pseudovibrio flavus]MTI18248.1 M23 family metallopeptidase [Pseudovibrio flavus]